MQSIGINAIGIGVVITAVLAFNFLFDIPFGIIADRWSRTGILIISLISMIICCLILGTANGLFPYIIGYGIFYGMYVVGTSGTAAAIVYDTLHEHSKSQLYSKVMGRAYAFYLAGIAAANIASGFLAHLFNFRFTYFITILSCFIAITILLTIKEPTFHKKEQKERALAQVTSVVRTIAKSKIIQVLTITFS